MIITKGIEVLVINSAIARSVFAGSFKLRPTKYRCVNHNDSTAPTATEDVDVNNIDM